MCTQHAMIPFIPSIEAIYFDGSTNEQVDFEHEIDNNSPALHARYAFMRSLSGVLTEDLSDPETPEEERAVSFRILELLSGEPHKSEDVSLALYPLAYLVLEQHLVNLNYTAETMDAIVNLIADTIDPDALGGYTNTLTDVDVFFAQTKGMELTAGIFIVVQKMIEAINLYRSKNISQINSASVATIQ